MAEPMSDEDLYHLTGSWEAAAALRDQQRQGMADVQPVQKAAEVAKPATLSATPTLAELKAMYDQLGAMQARENYTMDGTTVDYIPVQYGGGWSAWEKAPVQIGQIGDGMDAQPIFSDKKELGGFSKQEGDYVNTYDLQGNLIGRQKWNYNMLKQTIQDLGPIALAAVAGPGGAEWLGNTLFGLTGTAAAGAGGALVGGVNAYGNDQDILKGALLGGVSGAGSAKLGDILGADNVGSTLKNTTVGDVTKAINFAQNPTFAGAANLASKFDIPAVGVGDVSLNDILKGAGTAKALGSGDYNQMFRAITGMAADQGKSPRSSLAGFEANPDDFIEGYFQPGGEGYNALMAGDTTVLEDPQNLDVFLRMMSPYAADGGTSIFTQQEDLPEMETTSNRPITSLDTILGNPDILQEVPSNVTLPDNPEEMVITDKKEEPYIPSIRTKDIVSSIPDEVITADQIDKLFPNLKIEDILQTVTPGTKTPVTPSKTATTSTTPTTKQLLANLGLGGGQQAPIQDPYAQIKLMEEMFGPDIAYKLTSLNAPKNLASTDLDALARLLRG